jgi:predicted enzyme related to lactoylglutathione lyase
MAETTTIAAGTPSWVDLTSADIESSKAFYTKLFGWTAHVTPEPEAGGYTMFKKDGKEVAGVAPKMSDDSPEQWMTYVSVADARATAAKAAKAGGRILMEPMDVMAAGTMAVLMDPSGAAIALWQAGEHKGAELFNSPGSLSWNELNTRDVPAARKFYDEVFGWDPETTGEGAEEYTTFNLAGRGIAGMMDITTLLPEQIPPHWLSYFTVDDCAATTAKAKELGGEVRMPPMKVRQGTFSVIADPRGAVFAVISD